MAGKFYNEKGILMSLEVYEICLFFGNNLG